MVIILLLFCRKGDIAW